MKYSAADKKRIVDLLTELDLHKKDDGGRFAILRQNKRKLVKRGKSGLEVVANGRGEWIGSVELKTSRGPLYTFIGDERASDVIFLPWNREEEAMFFHSHSPQVLEAPPGWEAPNVDEVPVEAPSKAPPPPDIRTSLTYEQRVLSLRHTIDPGFVNHRRILAIVGERGRAAIDGAIARLPLMPEWQQEVRIDHRESREVRHAALGAPKRWAHLNYWRAALSHRRVRRSAPVGDGRSLAKLARSSMGCDRTPLGLVLLRACS